MSEEVLIYAMKLTKTVPNPDVFSEAKLTSDNLLQVPYDIQKNCLNGIASMAISSEKGVAEYCLREVVLQAYQTVIKGNPDLTLKDNQEIEEVRLTTHLQLNNIQLP